MDRMVNIIFLKHIARCCTKIVINISSYGHQILNFLRMDYRINLASILFDVGNTYTQFLHFQINEQRGESSMSAAR